MLARCQIERMPDARSCTMNTDLWHNQPNRDHPHTTHHAYTYPRQKFTPSSRAGRLPGTLLRTPYSVIHTSHNCDYRKSICIPNPGPGPRPARAPRACIGLLEPAQAQPMTSRDAHKTHWEPHSIIDDAASATSIGRHSDRHGHHTSIRNTHNLSEQLAHSLIC